MKEIEKSKGQKDQVYQMALEHIQKACRSDGIDAALKYTLENGEQIELDGLLMCDRKGVGQQLAAQAGYPIICIPIGLDEDGIPVALSIHHRAWQEARLIKWASAIEKLVERVLGRPPCPTYRNPLSKIVPVKEV